ncbi:glycosyltransferase family 4 protein [Candidatus Falkowbacteria bacterium]|nr:glycosyltransferase family 4 protein [Candidatus Falkowbacteria bacterium]
MKIGIDIRVLMDKNYSGVSKYGANLLLALFKQEQKSFESGLNNTYNLFYNSSKNIKDRLSIWENDFSQIKFLSWSNKIFNYFLQKTLSWPKLDLLLESPDIFWSPHFNFSSFSKNSKTKIVITVHDLSFIRYPEFFSWRKRFWHSALGIKKILNQADGIIAVSENTKSDLVELLGINEKKIRVIYSGLNQKISSETIMPINNFFPKLNLESGYLLYLGNIEPRKNLINLIKAYEFWRLKLSRGDNALPLVLAGAKGWKIKEIFSTWRQSKFKNDIYFLGYVNDEIQEALYQNAKLFIYPSFYEGFGFPPLEAMAKGLPVITSNVSSLPEIVADAALIIDPNKPLEIAKAIELVLKDEDYRYNLITKGLKRAELFSWDKTAKKYLAYFEDLVGLEK